MKFAGRFWVDGRRIMGCYTTELDRACMEQASQTGLFSRLRKRFAAMRRVESPEAGTAAGDQALAERLLARQPYIAPTRSRARVVHLIGSLSAGGAERQLVYLARESMRGATVEPRILVINPLEGAARHYLPLAQQVGVAVDVAGQVLDPTVARNLERDGELRRLLLAIDPRYRGWCVDLAAEFVRMQPDIVHAWLDHANIWGGIAALAAGVPHVVLSTRNVNPSNFPKIDAPYFLPWYRQLAKSPRVSFIGNSRVGAADYADWIGIPRARVQVVLNGFDPAETRRPAESELARLRTSLGLDNKRVVLGIFRIAEEKQPLDFAAAAEEILAAVPDAVVIVAGDGPMREELAARAAAIAKDRFVLLGRREDVAALASIADLLLHASRKEGSPNAVVEAQALGCPVVATRGGGTIDAVEHNGSGFLCDVGDTRALAAHAVEILRDDSLRLRLSARAPKFVDERFGLGRMVEESLACYPPRRDHAIGSTR